MITTSAINSQALSESTKNNYITRLEYMTKKFKKTLEELLNSPESTINQIRMQISKEPGTISSYCTALCKIMSIHPQYLKEHESEYDIFKNCLRENNEMRHTMYKKNNLTDSQTSKIVLYNDIHRRFCELEKDPSTWTNLKQNLHYVLFCILLEIKPKRADLGDVYISQNGRVPRSYIEKNYIIMNSENSFLVMNKYKTSKRYGTIREPLSVKLVEVLRRSLTSFPRQYLFVQSGKDKLKPYILNNSYSQFVKRAFETNFDRSQGVSLWRRVYISENVEMHALHAYGCSV